MFLILQNIWLETVAFIAPYGLNLISLFYYIQPNWKLVQMAFSVIKRDIKAKNHQGNCTF